MASLADYIRTAKGCKRCDFCRNVGDENNLLLLEEWETEEDLKHHMQSNHFKIIRGTANLLKEPFEMRFHSLFHQKSLIM